MFKIKSYNDYFGSGIPIDNEWGKQKLHHVYLMELMNKLISKNKF